MIGCIFGDMVGSRFEMKAAPVSSAFGLFTDSSIFTDDTVLSVAVAESIMGHLSYEESIRRYYSKYPYAGYGSAFKEWAKNPLSIAYDSFGNGSAMRVSPIGWAFDTEEKVLEEATRTAVLSHNNPEGIKGAKAIALAVFLARNGNSKDVIRQKVQELGYDQIEAMVEAQHVGFDVTCQITVPQAVYAFLKSNSTEDAVRRAVMIGGDTDTLACMAGAIAHAYYNDISKDVIDEIFMRLTPDLASVVTAFMQTYVDVGFNVEVKQSEDFMKKDIFRSLFS